MRGGSLIVVVGGFVADDCVIAVAVVDILVVWPIAVEVVVPVAVAVVVVVEISVDLKLFFMRNCVLLKSIRTV